MSTLKTYKLALATLPQGVSDYTYKLDTAFFKAMEQPDVYGADLDVNLHIEHKNETYYLHITMHGQMQIPCDRCLEPMDHAVDESEKLVAKYGAEWDDSHDGLLIIPESDSHLDMAPLLCDMALLSIPMRHVHEAGHCSPQMSELLRAHTVETIEEDKNDESPL